MRLLPLTGPAAAALLLAGLFEGNVPTDRSDGAVEAWLAANGDGGWLAHSAVSAIGGVLLVVYGQVLRDRLSRDEGPLERLVTSLATLTGTMVVVGAALFAAVPVGRAFEGSPDPAADVYRYLLGAAASVEVIFLAAPAAALCATVSVLGLRRASMPLWLGRCGVALAVLMLASAFVAPLMVFGLWLVISGVGLAFVEAGRVHRAPADVPVPAGD